MTRYLIKKPGVDEFLENISRGSPIWSRNPLEFKSVKSGLNYLDLIWVDFSFEVVERSQDTHILLDDSIIQNFKEYSRKKKELVNSVSPIISKFIFSNYRKLKRREYKFLVYFTRTWPRDFKYNGKVESIVRSISELTRDSISIDCGILLKSSEDLVLCRLVSDFNYRIFDLDEFYQLW